MYLVQAQSTVPVCRMEGITIAWQLFSENTKLPYSSRNQEIFPLYQMRNKRGDVGVKRGYTITIIAKTRGRDESV